MSHVQQHPLKVQIDKRSQRRRGSLPNYKESDVNSLSMSTTIYPQQQAFKTSKFNASVMTWKRDSFLNYTQNNLQNGMKSEMLQTKINDFNVGVI